jgi:hypothetical protein
MTLVSRIYTTFTRGWAEGWGVGRRFVVGKGGGWSPICSTPNVQNFKVVSVAGLANSGEPKFKCNGYTGLQKKKKKKLGQSLCIQSWIRHVLLLTSIFLIIILF